MLVTFLQTGNGTVSITGTQPDALAGDIDTPDAITVKRLMFFTPPVRNLNAGTFVDGVFAVEILVVAKTGNHVLSYHAMITIYRSAGVTTIVNTTVINSYIDAFLAGAAITSAVMPNGAVEINVQSNVAAIVQWGGLGVGLSRSTSG